MSRHIQSTRWLTPSILLVVIVLLFPGFKLGDEKDNNRNVKVWAHLSRQSFRPGDTGEMTITFAPSEGYHINANPTVTISIDDKKVILLKGSPMQVVDNSNGYLSTKSPVRQSIYIPSSTPAGFHVVKGAVTYFYCSDSEGRSRSFRQPISISFTLTP